MRGRDRPRIYTPILGTPANGFHGLKPSECSGSMSELKLRPPKEKPSTGKAGPSTTRASAPKTERGKSWPAPVGMTAPVKE